METPQPTPDEPEFLTVEQAARQRNISLSCVYRLNTKNKLTHYTFGDGLGAVRIHRDDSLDLIQRCRMEKKEGGDNNRRETEAAEGNRVR